MAQPTTPANISLIHSLENSPCSSKCDLEIQPQKPNQQIKEYASLKNMIMHPQKSSKVGALQVTDDTGGGGSGGRARNEAEEDESGRERLKRHRMEMGGRVWIPETWGQENSLKNWIDCTSFDASLVNKTILSARAALMQQRATTRTSTNNLTIHTRTIQNRC